MESCWNSEVPFSKKKKKKVKQIISRWNTEIEGKTKETHKKQKIKKWHSNGEKKKKTFKTSNKEANPI